MARYQKYKEVQGWNELESFYEKPISGFKIIFNGFNRTFCKCGEVLNENTEICPKCNNIDFLGLGEQGHYFSYKTKNLNKITKDKYGNDVIETFKVSLVINSINSDKCIEFKQEEENIGKLYRNHCEREVDSQFAINNFKYWNDYEDIFQILETKDLKNLKIAMNISNNFPLFLKDFKIYQYPNFSKFLFSEGVSHIKNADFETNMKYLKIPSEYLSAIDYNLKLQKINYYSFFSTSKNSLNFIIESIKNKKIFGFESLLEHYFVNNLISYLELQTIIEKLLALYEKDKSNDYAFSHDWEYYVPQKVWYKEKKYEGRIYFRDFFDISYMDFFEDYFKENIMNKKELIIESFISQIKFMLDNKIKISKDNLKLKNINFYINKNKLAEVYKIPETKVNFFLDMFEVSPIKALQLIKDRKKLTKKQIDEIIEIILKD